MLRMSSNKRVRAAKIGYIMLSALTGGLGVILIVDPGRSPVPLCRVCGVLLILFGAVRIFGYCSHDLSQLAFQYDLAVGVLLIAIGAVFLIRTRIMIHTAAVLLGVYILADGLLKIQTAIDARAFGVRQWSLILAAAIAAGVFGFLLVFRPSGSAAAMMPLLGIALLAESVLNLITVLAAVRVPGR